MADPDYSNTSQAPTGPDGAGRYLTPVSADPTSDWDLTDQLNELIAGVGQIDPNLVIPADQPDPPPTPGRTTNWASFRVTSTPGQAGAAYVAHDAAGDEGLGVDVLTDYEILVVLVSFYGPACERLARFFRDGLGVIQNWEQPRGWGMTPLSVGDVVGLQEQINDVWYRRADIEVRIRRRVQRTYRVRTIVEAEITIGSDAGPTVTEDVKNG